MSCKLRSFSVDLHIHTCLSPCAELEMLPELIVERAQQLNLDIIGVTDHNSSENALSVCNAARGTGITVLPGMEVQTREEAHVLALFDTIDQAWTWQAEVYASLPLLKNDPRFFGEQILLDPDGEPAGYLDRLLVTATDLSIEDVVARVDDLGGLVIPAHVDRPAFSIIANLGFVPLQIGITGVEISSRLAPGEARARFQQLSDFSLVTASDAHRLDDMQTRTSLGLNEPTVGEIRLALAGARGRWASIDGVCTNPTRSARDSVAVDRIV
ncbi:MAG: PHP domain-containing protein [Chloroflexi bacterium]|nr:PHP domain-containing protein [Chloroflexota bacterium]